MTAVKIGKEVLQVEINGLTMLKDALNGDFSKAVDWLYEAKGRIIITGIGKSGHIGRKIAASLASLGSPAFFVHSTEASHGDLGMVGGDDIILAISYGGESTELTDILLYAKRFHIRLIAITKNKESTLGKAADLVLELPDAPEAVSFGMAPTTSTTMTLAMGDALAVALLEKRGFTKEHYKVRHPGGKLGRQMLKVSDVMVKGDAVPLVKPADLMGDVLVTMSAKGFGIVGVSADGKRLLGIISDGDLRRHMDDKLLSKKAENIMTPKPLTVPSDMFAAEAFSLMNAEHNQKTRNITKLFVVDDGTLKGLLSIHDMIRAGVA